MRQTGCKAYVHEKEAMPGPHTLCGTPAFFNGRPCRLKPRHTWGHSLGGTSYVITGLSLPVAIVGDALFAGSIGRPFISYQAALATIRTEIFTLDPATILCPGTRTDVVCRRGNGFLILSFREQIPMTPNHALQRTEAGGGSFLCIPSLASPAFVAELESVRRPARLLDFHAVLRHLAAMQTDAFERSLRAFVRRTPFVPFTVELTSGTRFQVLHPEALAFNGGLAVYIGTDGTPSLFDPRECQPAHGRCRSAVHSGRLTTRETV